MNQVVIYLEYTRYIPEKVNLNFKFWGFQPEMSRYPSIIDRIIGPGRIIVSLIVYNSVLIEESYVQNRS